MYTLLNSPTSMMKGFDYYRPSASKFHHIVLNFRAVSHVFNVHDLVVLRRDVVFVQNPLQKGSFYCESRNASFLPLKLFLFCLTLMALEILPQSFFYTSTPLWRQIRWPFLPWLWRRTGSRPWRRRRLSSPWRVCRFALSGLPRVPWWCYKIFKTELYQVKLLLFCKLVCINTNYTFIWWNKTRNTKTRMRKYKKSHFFFIHRYTL